MRNLIIAILLSVNPLHSCIMDPLEELKPDSSLKIINNSNIDLLYNFSSGYPDTILTMQSPFTNQSFIDSSTIIKDSFRVISTTFRQMFNSKDGNFKFIIFLLDKKEVLSNEWKIIRDENRIMHRYELSQKELDSLNWEISYPLSLPMLKP